MTRAFFAAVLLAAPAGAAETRRELQRRLVGEYLADAREAFAACRADLEILQEVGLTPHASDEPVESALLHLDLAQAYIVAGEPTFFGPLDPGKEGGESYDRRAQAALGILRAKEPELARVYDAVPIRLGPLPPEIMGEFRSSTREVILRGHFALSPPPAPYLAALLAHEAAHALQFPPDGEPSETKEEREAEARAAEARLWREAGAGPQSDYGGEEAALAASIDSGSAAFKSYLTKAGTSENALAWNRPPLAARTPPEAEIPRPPGNPTAAQTLDFMDRTLRKSRRERLHAAAAALARAREILVELTELAAPFPKIADADLMRLWILQPGRYPDAMTRVFQALTPALDEIDKTRAALESRRIGADERERLTHYAGGRNSARAPSAADAARIAALLGRDAPPLACYPYPQARMADPRWIGVPGAWQCRAGRPEIAAAWAAHVLAHRAQKLAPDARPTLSQELEAVQASLKVWKAADADPGFDDEHPDRFLPYRVSDQSGALRLYLRSLGFRDPSPR